MKLTKRLNGSYCADVNVKVSLTMDEMATHFINENLGHESYEDDADVTCDKFSKLVRSTRNPRKVITNSIWNYGVVTPSYRVGDHYKDLTGRLILVVSAELTVKMKVKV